MQIRHLCTILAASVSIVAWRDAARAGPLEPSFAPSAPAWLVHLDLEAARSSQLGAILLDSLATEQRASIDSMAQDFGLTSPQSIRSITVFADSNDPVGAALIVLGPDADNLPSVLQSRNMQEFESSVHEDSRFMSWATDGKTIRAALVTLDEQRRALIFAKTEDCRMRSVNRLRSNAARTESSSVEFEPGAILSARIVQMNSESERGPRARILKLATSIDARFIEMKSENGTPECSTRISMTAADAQSAEAMRNLCTGLFQAARLSMTKDAELSRFEKPVFDPITMSIDDSTLTLQARHSSEDLAMLLQAMRSLAQSRARDPQPHSK